MLSFARRQDLNIAAARRVRADGWPARPAGAHARAVDRDRHAHLAAMSGRARADANQLELAILNLAVNARDAMPDGRRDHHRDTRGDDGASELRPRARYVMSCLSLRRYWRRHGRRDAGARHRAVLHHQGRRPGTGLGLSMVHGFAEQLSGRLALKSRKGEGTTAELWLPVSEGEARKMPAPEDREEEAPSRRAPAAYDSRCRRRCARADEHHRDA